MPTTRKVQIINKLGLHARAASKFVATASNFSSEVDVSNGDNSVNGKSIMGILMLAASKGTELTLTTTGDDEANAMEALVALVAERFGEED